MTEPPLAAAYRTRARRHCRSIPSAGDPGRKDMARRHPRPPRRWRARWASVARRRGSRSSAAASLAPAETGAAAPREKERGGKNGMALGLRGTGRRRRFVPPRTAPSRRIRSDGQGAAPAERARFGPRGRSRCAAPGRFRGPVVSCWAKSPGAKGARDRGPKAATGRVNNSRIEFFFLFQKHFEYFYDEFVFCK